MEYCGYYYDYDTDTPYDNDGDDGSVQYRAGAAKTPAPPGLREIPGSKWYIDSNGDLYNSKKKLLNYHRNAEGNLVYQNSEGETKYLPKSAVQQLSTDQTYNTSFSSMNAVEREQVALAMQNAVPR